MNRIDEVMAKVIQYGREQNSAGYYDCAQRDEGSENCYRAAEALEDELRALVGEMERDAARYRWLESLYKGFDYDWKLADDEPGQAVILFNYPDDFRLGANLGQCIDAVLAQQSPK